MNKDTIRISAKTIGALAMPDFCPRCFWLQLKVGFKLPYQIFPGIFSSIDSYSKKITLTHHEHFGKPPHWLKPFGDLVRPVKIPSRNEFFIFDEAANIQLTGVPDEIFQKKDGSYFIADYKTAKFTEAQDSLMPIYKVQLNGYALIAEKCGLSPVSGIGLVYYEPQSNVTSDTLETVLLEKGFYMPFNAYIHEIELAPEKTIMPLLKEVRKLADKQEPPESIANCDDCQKLDYLIRFAKI